MKYPVISVLGTLAMVFVLSSCRTDPNSAGYEYMPDMYRSPALEAYIDYGSNKHMDWTLGQKADAGVQMRLSRKPAPGTIPYVGEDMAAFVMPYPLNNTPEDYERAATEVHSPLLANQVSIEKGMEIYGKMCKHCHGQEGHGDGGIVKNGKLAGIPDYATKLKDLPEGKMFHTITYGKGLMGSHASQLNKLERWQVIEYVKCLQKGISTPEFDKEGNLTSVAAPAAEAAPTAETTPAK